MAGRLKLSIIMLTLFVSIILAGCKPNPVVDYIQGMWIYDDQHLRKVIAEPHWIETWEFDDGSFANRGCCFGEVNIVGNYRIVESDENSVLLELYNMQGIQANTPLQKDDRFQMKIKLNEDGTLTIGSTAGYERIADAYNQ